MKKIIIIVFTVISFTAAAQSDSLQNVQDSLKAVQLNKIKAKSLAIKPIVVSMTGDTAIYLHWRAFDVDRADTSAGIGTLVSLIDRNGKVVAHFNEHIPSSVVNQWALDPTPIDEYILSRNPRIKRKTQ